MFVDFPIGKKLYQLQMVSDFYFLTACFYLIIFVKLILINCDYFKYTNIAKFNNKGNSS